jgi:hypothetical protein
VAEDSSGLPLPRTRKHTPTHPLRAAVDLQIKKLASDESWPIDERHRVRSLEILAVVRT